PPLQFHQCLSALPGRQILWLRVLITPCGITGLFQVVPGQASRLTTAESLQLHQCLSALPRRRILWPKVPTNRCGTTGLFRGRTGRVSRLARRTIIFWANPPSKVVSAIWSVNTKIHAATTWRGRVSHLAMTLTIDLGDQSNGWALVFHAMTNTIKHSA